MDTADYQRMKAEDPVRYKAHIAKKRAYNIKHADRVKERSIIWRKKNRERLLAYAKRYRAERYADPVGREIIKQQSRAEQKRNALRYELRRIERAFNVSREEAERLHALRAKGCEVCGSTFRAAIDHCHDVSGRIRGILCEACNLSAGKMKDNVANIRKLADYLEAR